MIFLSLHVLSVIQLFHTTEEKVTVAVCRVVFVVSRPKVRSSGLLAIAGSVRNSPSSAPVRFEKYERNRTQNTDGNPTIRFLVATLEWTPSGKHVLFLQWTVVPQFSESQKCFLTVFCRNIPPTLSRVLVKYLGLEASFMRCCS